MSDGPRALPARPGAPCWPTAVILGAAKDQGTTAAIPQYLICNTALTTVVHTLYIRYVDTHYALHGQAFEWDSEKAAANSRKHNVTFHEACEVFFDPFFRLTDAAVEGEARHAAIGYTERSRCLCVVHVEREEGSIRIISVRLATAEERKFYEHE